MASIREAERIAAMKSREREKIVDESIGLMIFTVPTSFVSVLTFPQWSKDAQHFIIFLLLGTMAALSVMVVIVVAAIIRDWLFSRNMKEFSE